MKDATWIEMFGCDELEPLRKEVPPLALDNPLWLENVMGGSAERVADESLVKEISGCDWKPIFTPIAAAPPLEFTKRATSKALTRRDISARMSKHYRHGVWRGWEKMMETYIGTAVAEFDERAALSFLEVA